MPRLQTPQQLGSRQTKVERTETFAKEISDLVHERTKHHSYALTERNTGDAWLKKLRSVKVIEANLFKQYVAIMY